MRRKEDLIREVKVLEEQLGLSFSNIDYSMMCEEILLRRIEFLQRFANKEEHDDGP